MFPTRRVCTLRAPPFYRYWPHCYTLCIVTASPPLSRSTDPRAAYHPSQPLQRHSALFSLSILRFVATARFSFSSFSLYYFPFFFFFHSARRAKHQRDEANVFFIANLQFPFHKISLSSVREKCIDLEKYITSVTFIVPSIFSLLFPSPLYTSSRTYKIALILSS